MSLIARRRNTFNTTSYLRIRNYTIAPYSGFQIRPPSWTAGTYGNMSGYYLSNNRQYVYILSNSTSYLRIYANSNPDGIVEQQSDLTFTSQTTTLALTIAEHGIAFIPVFFWINESINKIYAVESASTYIVMYDYNPTTNNVTYNSRYNFGVSNNVQGFYFSNDGLKLYTSNNLSVNNLGVHTLSTAFDINTITSSVYSTVSDSLRFNARPVFFNNGTRAFMVRYDSSTLETYISQPSFSTPYDASTASVQPNLDKKIDSTTSGFRLLVSCRNYMPIYLSNDLSKLMYGNNNYNTTGGRIGGFFGVGDFDFPASFESGILAGDGGLII